jgi:hypothetical protein
MFFFGTINGLETQLDVFISLMNPAFLVDEVWLLLLCVLAHQIFEEVAS